MEKNLERIAFVILNYNTCNLTINCFNKLKKIDESLKIIIVDNNSNDESKEKLIELEKYKNTNIIINKENKGYAAGNNIGLKYIAQKMPEIEVAFILNPDIEIAGVKDIYNLYKTLINNSKLAAITSITIYNGKLNTPNECCWKFLNKRQVVLNGSLIGKLFHKDLHYKSLELNDYVANVDVIQGCFFGIKMDVLKKIGYLDEQTFLYCEEQILGRKINNIGMNVGVMTNTFIHHNHFEKDKKMKNKKNRIFHLKCLRDSRKILLKYYLNLNKYSIIVKSLFLDVDFFLKKILISLGF